MQEKILLLLNFVVGLSRLYVARWLNLLAPEFYI
jgi:hypothetical protein